MESVFSLFPQHGEAVVEIDHVQLCLHPREFGVCFLPAAPVTLFYKNLETSTSTFYVGLAPSKNVSRHTTELSS
jgi:hypothetical protein